MNRIKSCISCLILFEIIGFCSTAECMDLALSKHLCPLKLIRLVRIAYSTGKKPSPPLFDVSLADNACLLYGINQRLAVNCTCGRRRQVLTGENFLTHEFRLIQADIAVSTQQHLQCTAKSPGRILVSESRTVKKMFLKSLT